MRTAVLNSFLIFLFLWEQTVWNSCRLPWVLSGQFTLQKIREKTINLVNSSNHLVFLWVKFHSTVLIFYIDLAVIHFTKMNNYKTRWRRSDVDQGSIIIALYPTLAFEYEYQPLVDTKMVLVQTWPFDQSTYTDGQNTLTVWGITYNESLSCPDWQSTRPLSTEEHKANFIEIASVIAIY